MSTAGLSWQRCDDPDLYDPRDALTDEELARWRRRDLLQRRPHEKE